MVLRVRPILSGSFSSTEVMHNLPKFSAVSLNACAGSVSGQDGISESA